MRLAISPGGRPLFEERGNTFAGIFKGGEFVEICCFGAFECLSERQLQATADDALHYRENRRAFRKELDNQLFDGRAELIASNGAIHKATPLGLRRADRFAEEHHLRRAL